MANRTAWTGGNLFAGLSYTAAFNAGDINSLPTGSSVLSTVAAFTNGTSLDQLVKISFKLSFSVAETIVAGANIAFWAAYLQEDGTTYGDGRLVAGTQAAYQPPWAPLGAFPIQAGSVSTIAGDIGLLAIEPVSFALIVMNNSGFALNSTGNAISILSYNQQLNN